MTQNQMATVKTPTEYKRQLFKKSSMMEIEICRKHTVFRIHT